MKRETSSLGPVEKFDTLASLARIHGVWRKVARLVCKRNSIHDGWPKFKARNHLDAKIYLTRALRDTRLPYVVTLAIAEMYLGDDIREEIQLTQRCKLASMTP